MKNLKLSALIILVFLISTSLSMAQCAMCQQVVSSNLSDGRGSVIGRGINTGVLFLLTTPYLLIGFGIYFWYKSAKKNSQEKLTLENRLKEILR